MPSIRAYNQMAPFWDWVASFEDQAASHPWAAGNNPRGTDDTHEPPNPWASWGPWGAGFPHRGRHGPWNRPHGPHHGPPPPPPPAGAAAPPPPPGFEETTPVSSDDETETMVEMKDLEVQEPRPADDTDGEKKDKSSGERCRGGMRGRGGARGRGGCSAFGNGHGRVHGHGHGHGRRNVDNNNDEHQQAGEPSSGHRSGRRHGPGRPPFPFAAAAFGNGLGEFFQNQIFGDQAAKDKEAGTFRPEVDVFDGSEAFVVHISLPGAKKEDVGVHWEADKSELTIAGVVYRPADEEMLKTLAMDERKVGEFERKVRLGSRSRPAQVDVDGISARMEDGVLRIEVPKLDSGYVDIKRVDIE